MSQTLLTVRPRLAAKTAVKTRSGPEAGTKELHYRPVSKEDRRDGFQFRQIVREGDVAIYEQTWNGCPHPSICYEAIRLRRHEDFEIDGRVVPAAELRPKSESWGTDGFTFTDRDAAFAKLRELVGMRARQRWDAQ